MAKLPFSKLGVKSNTDVALVTYGDYTIEVRKYLPMDEKAKMITTILNYSADDTNFYSPLKVKVFLTLEVMYTYTNLSFTDKMKENYLKLYDTVVSSGLFDEIVKAIPEEEWDNLQDTIWDTIDNIYNYKNSAAGVIEVIANNYNATNFDLATIQEKLSNPDEMTLLKEILPLLNSENDLDLHQ